jgi:hypothetical protein
LIHAADLGPAKPRLDVLIEGAVLFPAPIEEADVTLEIGSRLRKTVKVFGDRVWYARPGSGVVPSRPKAATKVPIAWERSFGGRDPKDPTCVERRNPAGTGMCREPGGLVDHPAPSFEDPTEPLKSSKDRPPPRGFGPIAPHWLPRSKLAGTFDDRWQKERWPLLPEDFDPAFFNVAPNDQQLDRFIPGEEVRLTSMTVAGRDRFLLPDLLVPVTFVSDRTVFETASAVDTLIIEPAERRFSLLARATFSPRPTILALREIVVGEPSMGRRRAIAAGKRYLGPTRARAREPA